MTSAIARVGRLPEGSKGLDANRRISIQSADTFAEKQFKFAVRYIRREKENDHDLVREEVEDILEAGLGLMVVQHVAPPGWKPSGTLGTAYGLVAAAEACSVGILKGVTVWCDLEEVSKDTLAIDVIEYCNNWYDEVKRYEFEPGLYVGYDPGLSSTQLYRSLKFQRYWGAYNQNSDQIPIVRGNCMKQRVAAKSDLIAGFTNQNMDIDFIGIDKLGGTPSLLLPK